ncbi:hypothetical protein RhiirA4_457748 [Rhizophagus irregularis]|uniref:Uncharacterized protein n=1 Tax=Rhizophagus irregularis TaxID=588596 RepID=A0A2I1GAQ2_9GLOM|nr:hypothetical protein RhiirA4_457748 [Rhizophagus irregularis]
MKHYMDKGIPIEMIVLLLRKGVFPYEYIDSYEKFKETSITPIEKFHGVLKRKITPKDYKHAEKVLNEFKCKNLGKVKVELFTDMEMHDFAEKARRGGITMAYEEELYSDKIFIMNFGSCLLKSIPEEEMIISCRLKDDSSESSVSSASSVICDIPKKKQVNIAKNKE